MGNGDINFNPLYLIFNHVAEIKGAMAKSKSVSRDSADIWVGTSLGILKGKLEPCRRLFIASTTCNRAKIIT